MALKAIFRFINIFLVSLLLFFINSGVSENHYHILIKNGTIIDGTGKPSFISDIGISGRKIVKIGSIKASEATEIIDAQGLIVAPGFITATSSGFSSSFPSWAFEGGTKRFLQRPANYQE
ncbi:MAG: hypothetical protein R6V00_06705 [Candidatus Aminicenantes bacterium]